MVLFLRLFILPALYFCTFQGSTQKWDDTFSLERWLHSLLLRTEGNVWQEALRFEKVPCHLTIGDHLVDGYKKEASHYVSEHVIKEDRKKHNYNKIKYFFENPGQTILIYNPGDYYWVYARILDETLSKILFVEIRLYVERDETLTELAYSYLVLSPLGGKFEYYF